MDPVDTGVVVELTEKNIPGAFLCEPLEIYTIPTLKWYLLCHSIKPPSSWKKPDLISR